MKPEKNNSPGIQDMTLFWNQLGGWVAHELLVSAQNLKERVSVYSFSLLFPDLEDAGIFYWASFPI
jgi:hypothetical protein